jgi:hypothetical protein
MINTLSGRKPGEARVGVGQQNLGVVELGHRTTVQDEDLSENVSNTMERLRVYIPCRS